METRNENSPNQNLDAEKDEQALRYLFDSNTNDRYIK